MQKRLEISFGSGGTEMRPDRLTAIRRRSHRRKLSPVSNDGHAEPASRTGSGEASPGRAAPHGSSGGCAKPSSPSSSPTSASSSRARCPRSLRSTRPEDWERQTAGRTLHELRPRSTTSAPTGAWCSSRAWLGRRRVALANARARWRRTRRRSSSWTRRSRPSMRSWTWRRATRPRRAAWA